MSRRDRKTSEASPPRRWSGAFAGVVLVLAILTAYGPALRGGFIWDDDFYVSGNETLGSIAGLWSIWFRIGATPQYYPLVFTSFWVERAIWGTGPFHFHLVNVLLHAANAVLVWRIGRRLDIPGALAVAFLFGLHPVHVESVAWITERKNVLSGFFYLASMASFLRASPPESKEDASPSWPWYVLSLLLFGGALSSKSVTATLPIALLMIDGWKTGRVRGRQALLVAPMIVVGAAAGWLTTWVEAHHVGTRYIAWNLSLLDRTLIAAHAVWFYLGKLLLPVRLTFIYPRWHIDAGALSSYLALLLGLAAIVTLWLLRGRWGRGPVTAIVFFVVTLLPALGFIDVFPMRFSFVADHFQYLASLGPITLACAFAARRLDRPLPLVPLAFSLSILLAVLTYRQSGIYRDLETLWRDTLAKNPRATIASINLGNLLNRDGRWREADELYQRAVDDPDCLDRADVLRNLALNASEHGDTARAIEFLKRAIAERPAFATALVNLGELQRGRGQRAEAVESFERAVEADPNDPVARIDLGSARFDANRPEEAVVQFQAAIALKPDSAEAHYNLGNALAKLKRSSEAESEYATAIRLRPTYATAHINLANLMLQSGRVDEAIAHLQTSLSQDPDNPLAHYALSYGLARQGRGDEAASHYRQARKLRPDLPPPPGVASP